VSDGDGKKPEADDEPSPTGDDSDEESAPAADDDVSDDWGPAPGQELSVEAATAQLSDDEEHISTGWPETGSVPVTDSNAVADSPPSPPPDQAESLPDSLEHDYAAEARAWREELSSAVLDEPVDKGKKPGKGKKASKAKKAAKDKRPAGDKQPRQISRRTMMFAIGAGLFAVLIAIFIVLGYFNSRDYFLVCGSEHITGERGRKFPPWGRSTVPGRAWTPIQIPANAECVNQEFDNTGELEEVFTLALVEQAEALLTSGQPASVEVAEKQLLQALLLTRKPERRDLRKKIERLRGDVEYWRAAAQIETIVTRLSKAGERFDDAASRRPRLNSNASAWAKFARTMSDEIRRGPPELRDDKPIGPDTRPPFADTVPTPTASPNADAGVPAADRADAEPGVALPPEVDATPAPADAGLPRGGVLL
jgi:hypothetical protein